MSELYSKNRVYSVLRVPVCIATRRVFGKVTVEGLDNIPSGAAVIFTPNHCNTLMDALVVLQAYPKLTAFGARADIFRKPMIKSILRFCRMVPLARMRDGVETLKDNHAAFDEIIDCLGHDTAFCIFPEGTHHESYQISQIKNGVFRLAEQAREKLDRKIYIVPVGLSYSDFKKPQADVWVRFGKAIDADEVLSMGVKERQTYLMDRIQELIFKPETKKRRALGIALLPLFLPALLLCFPMLIASGLLIRKSKDKLWANTIRFATRLGLGIVLTLVYGVLGFCLLPWWTAVTLIVFLWLSPRICWSVIGYLR